MRPLYYTFAIALLTACGPGPAMGGESEDGGETGNPTPGEDHICVEMVQNQVTCWVAWGDVHARAFLQCEVDSAVNGLAWGPAYADDIPGWGSVMCHDILGTGNAVCLFGGARVVLTETAPDVWTPDLSPLVIQWPEVDPPCGECPVMSEGCECSEFGECALGLTCVDGVCEVCPSGQIGCWCHPDETCDGDLVCDGFVCEEPVQCGPDVCQAGYGCTLADTCVDCDFVTGVYGCACNISNECEGTSVCEDGVCSPY